MNATGPTSADLAAGHERLADFLAAVPANYPAEQLHREVTAWLLGRLQVLLAISGDEWARVTALCDTLAVSDWRTQLSARQAATACGLAFVDAFDVRQDGDQFRVECGLCGWTLRDLANFTAAWTAADAHTDVCPRA